LLFDLNSIGEEGDDAELVGRGERDHPTGMEGGPHVPHPPEEGKCVTAV